MYEYAKRYYGVVAKPGQRVRHIEIGALGTVARVPSYHGRSVVVRFDGTRGEIACHPLALDYAPRIKGAA